VMSKIAYREWKERKLEEARHARKQERMEERRLQEEENEHRRQRAERLMEM